MKKFYILSIIHFLLVTQMRSQIDTIKPNWGINNWEIGKVSLSDIAKEFPSKGIKVISTSEDFKIIKLKKKGIKCTFIKVDSAFILKRISIHPIKSNWHLLKDITISKQTKLKDLIPKLDSFYFGHILHFNSVEYLYTELIYGTTLFRLKQPPAKTDDRMSNSSHLKETLVKLYSNSKIKSINISSDIFDKKINHLLPNAYDSTKPLQLFYSRIRDKSYYKNSDSLIIIKSSNGCEECSYEPGFSVNKFDEKNRILEVYGFSGFVPFLDLRKNYIEIVEQLSKQALNKAKYIYNDKRSIVHIKYFQRKSTKSIYKLVRKKSKSYLE